MNKNETISEVGLQKKGDSLLQSPSIQKENSANETTSLSFQSELPALPKSRKHKSIQPDPNILELQKELENYQDIFNNQAVGMYRIRVLPMSKWKEGAWSESANSPYILEMVSDRCCTMLGISRQEFTNNPYIISDLVYADDKISFVKANEKANKKGIPFHWEGRLLINKEIVWIRLESLPRKLKSGEIIWTGVLHNITEQKNAEEAINTSMLRLEDVLIGANVGTLEWNVQTGEMRFNDILAKNLGYSSKELKLLAKKQGADLWKEFTHPDDIMYAGEMIYRHFTGEFPYHSIEVRMKHKKGHWVWIRQEGKVMTWTPDGQPLLMLGTHTDISNRKEIEENLRQSEEKYRILFENNPQPMLIAHPLSLRILEINNAFILHYGYSREELLSMSINDLHLKADEDDMLLTVAKIRNGETETDVKRHKKKNGEIIFVEIKIHKIEFNGVVAAHTLINDVTGRVMAEQALSDANNKLEERIAERTSELLKLNASLRESEQKFKTANDFTTDWEYWKSPDNKIIFMSPSVERITGYSIEEFEKNPELLDKIIYKNDISTWESHKNERGNHVANENTMEEQFRIVKKDGEVRWIGHVCRSIRINNTHLGVRVSNRDITEKVNAEKALLGITVEVEERERNRFSRELHDGLGPLLSTIKIYFDWMTENDDVAKKELIAETGNEFIETAIQTTRELSHGLSSQLLSSLGYIRSIQDFIDRINDSHKININLATNTTNRFNSFVETALYRVTTELIKNTLTYANATHANIKINYDEKKNNIQFTYSDNGVGFDLEKTFNSPKGMGLLNIRQRIQILKGCLQIESSPGNGMKVVIQLPVEEID